MFSLIAAVVPHGAPRADVLQSVSKHDLSFVMSTNVDNVIGFLKSVSFKEDGNATIPSSANGLAKCNLISTNLNLPMPTEQLVPPGFEHIAKEIGNSQSQNEMVKGSAAKLFPSMPAKSVNKPFSSSFEPPQPNQFNRDTTVLPFGSSFNGPNASPEHSDENRQDPKEIRAEEMTPLPEEHQQSLSNKQVPLHPVPSRIDNEEPRDVFESPMNEPFDVPLTNSDEWEAASMTNPVMPLSGHNVSGKDLQIPENTVQNSLVLVNGSNASDGELRNPIVSDADSVPSDEACQDVNAKNNCIEKTPEVKKEVLEPDALHGVQRNIFEGVKTEPFDRPLLNPDERDIDIAMDSDEAERTFINSGANGSTQHRGLVPQVVTNNIPFRSDEVRQDMNSQEFGFFVDSTDDFAPEPEVKEEVPPAEEVNPRSINARPTEMDLLQAANDEPIRTVDERDFDMEVDDIPEGIVKNVKLERFDKPLVNPDETEVDLMDDSDESDKDCGDSDEQADPKGKKATLKKTKKMPGTSVVSKTMKKHRCDVCEKSFFYSAGLAQHYQIHTGFECKVCQKPFNYKHNLDRHMRVHAGETPFECEVCQKKFSCRNMRKNHMRIHGKKPFGCDICGKRVATKPHMESHMRTHTGSKPFECKDCQMKFTHQMQLKRHNNRCHP